MHPSSLHARLWHIAWPMMLSNVTVPLLGLVDTAVLGHLDNPSYLAGVALANTLFTSVFWLFGFLRMGTCGMTAQAVGRQDTTQVLELLRSGAWFAVIMGISLILFSADWLNSGWITLGLQLLAGEPSTNQHVTQALQHNQTAVLAQAHTYADWRVLGAPFVMLNYCLIGWFVGRQNTRVPLMMLITANLINILLDVILVVYLDMGVTGVAIATLVADISTVVLGCGFVLIHYRHELHRLPHWLPQWPVIQEMVRVNRYIFIRTGTLLFTFALFTSQGARLGDEYLAANAVLLTFLLLISSSLDGFAHGAEALVGEACGQKNHAQVKRVINVSLLWSAVSALTLLIAFGIGGQLLISALTDLETIRQLASHYLPWLVIMPIIGVWCYTFDGVFIGATKVRAMQNIMLCSTFLIFIPILAINLRLTEANTNLANHGLWLAMILFMLSRSGGMGLMCWYYSKHRRWFSN